MSKIIYVDYDSCIVDSVDAICKLYNQDFKYYKNFKKINSQDIYTWDFKELSCAPKDYVKWYFTQPRFFDVVEFMPYAQHKITELILNGYEIHVVSIGYYANLVLKREWLKKHLPNTKFIGIDFDNYKTKKCIDMKDGLAFIDDNVKYLYSSNCKRRILYGQNYEWNKTWKGERLISWENIKIKNNFDKHLTNDLHYVMI